MEGNLPLLLFCDLAKFCYSILMDLVSIDIRQALKEDAKAIASVHLASWKSTYQGIIPSPVLEQMLSRRGREWWQKAIVQKTYILVLEFNGLIVGYATLGANRSLTLPFEGEIFELYLLPHYQGVGLGSRLFKKVKEILSDYGLHQFVAWILKENEPARCFYEKMGGVIVSTSFENFGDHKLIKLAYSWR